MVPFIFCHIFQLNSILAVRLVIVVVTKYTLKFVNRKQCGIPFGSHMVYRNCLFTAPANGYKIIKKKIKKINNIVVVLTENHTA